MFTAPPDELLAILDQILGGRDQTQEVIALASAAVLTASPIAEQDTWLQAVCKSIPYRSDLSDRSGIVVDSQRGISTHPHADNARQLALKHLLDTLHHQHGGSTAEILERLSLIAADALSSADPAGIERWTQLLRRTHRSVRHDYLASNPGLN